MKASTVKTEGAKLVCLTRDACCRKRVNSFLVGRRGSRGGDSHKGGKKVALTGRGVMDERDRFVFVGFNRALIIWKVMGDRISGRMARIFSQFSQSAQPINNCPFSNLEKCVTASRSRMHVASEHNMHEGQSSE